jgi:hypothetical protein
MAEWSRRLFIAYFGLLIQSAFAQEDTLVPSEESSAKIGVDEAPFVSSRAEAMGGALSTLADEIDSPFRNPAGIGGLKWGKERVGWLRKLYFPRVALTANRNSYKLNQEFSNQGGVDDSAIGAAIVDAAAGERQYARFNFGIGFVLGRFMAFPYSDVQLAANSQGEASQLIDVNYRSTSGMGYGFSMADSKGTFSLGYFGYSASVSETFGTFSYSELVNPLTRKDALKEKTKAYSGGGHNAGLVWQIAKSGAPTVAIVATDIGGTKLQGKEGESKMIEKDLTLGFSLSPQLSKSICYNFILEATKLQDSDTAVAKKFRTGSELTFGRPGSYATFAIRAGYNSGGGAYGLYLNLGLLGFSVSERQVDVGPENKRVVEARTTATFFVNVSEF